MKQNVILLTALACIAALVTWLSLPSLSREKTDRKNNLLVASHIYDQLYTMVTKPIIVSRSMAQDKLLVRALKEEQEKSQEEMEALMNDYLSNLTSTFGYTVAFVVSEKTRRYYTPNGIAKIVDPANDPYDIWYQLFLSSGNPLALDPDRDQINGYRWTLFLNCRITDEKDNLVGVCGVGLFMDNLQEIISQEEKDHGIKINFIGKDGLVLVDTDYGNIENAYLPDALSDAAEQGRFSYQKRHDLGYRMTRYVPELEWYLVIQSLSGSKVAGSLPALLLVYALLLLLLLLNLKRSSKKGAHDRIADSSPTDMLTGLPNRNYVRDSFGEQGIFNTTRYKTLAMFDVDCFKSVCEERDGDAIICGIAKIASETLEERGMLFRWAGDEFVCFLELEMLQAEESLKALCESIKKELSVTISAGLVEVDLSESIKTNYHRAVQLCYAVKERGGNGVQGGA